MKIVSVKGRPRNDPDVVYCGRPFAGWAGSPLANPCSSYKACPVCAKKHSRDRGESLPCYRKWLWGRILAGDREVLRSLLDLQEDSVLGCWCTEPTHCHCGVIERAWRWAQEEIADEDLDEVLRNIVSYKESRPGAYDKREDTCTKFP